LEDDIIVVIVAIGGAVDGAVDGAERTDADMRMRMRMLLRGMCLLLFSTRGLVGWGRGSSAVVCLCPDAVSVAAVGTVAAKKRATASHIRID
jgi:hypothetical protein